MAACFHSKGSCTAFGFVLLVVGGALAAPLQDTDWWNRPCHEVNPANERHARSTHSLLQYVRMSLRVTINSTSVQLRQLHALFGEKGPKVPQIALKWLKKNKMVKALHTSNDISKMLTSFFDSLQQFAITSHLLSQVSVQSKSETFDLEKRAAVYGKVQDRLRLVMCEVYEVISYSNHKRPPKAKSIDEMKIPKDYFRVMDNTGTYINDVNFLKKLLSFYKNSITKLKMRNKNKRKRYLVRGKSGENVNKRKRMQRKVKKLN